MINFNIQRKDFSGDTIFRNARLRIKDSQKINIITGPSGCGKTTFLSMLYGLDQVFEGEYTLFWREYEEHVTTYVATNLA